MNVCQYPKMVVHWSCASRHSELCRRASCGCSGQGAMAEFRPSPQQRCRIGRWLPPNHAVQHTIYMYIYIYMTIITSPKSTCIWLVSTSFNFPTLPYLKAAFTDQRFPGKARVAKQRWAQRSGVGSTAGDHQQCLCLMVPWRSLCNHLGQWRRRGWQQQSARTIEPLGKDTKNH